MVGHQLCTFALLWVCVAVCCACKTEPTCAMYDHKDYGTVGKCCISATSCPGKKYITGLCPSHKCIEKCCFTANTDNECATYVHPDYGQVGHCTHTSLCPDNAYISGLCPNKCAGIKCCFKKPTSRIEGCVGNVKSLACDIQGHSRIDLLGNNGILNSKGNYDGADAMSNIRDTCAGKKSLISCYSCTEGTAPGGSVCLGSKVLEYILSLANDGHDIQVNAISGACHSSNSLHYEGRAVDLQIVESSNYAAWGQKCMQLGGSYLGPDNDPSGNHNSHLHCQFQNN